MTKPDYDLVIIGGGPAGLAAGLYASRANLNVILFEEMAAGGQILVSDWVENYPGFPEGLSGFDLSQNFLNQTKKFGLKVESTQIVDVDFSDKIKKLTLSNHKSITSHTVIISTGAAPKKIGIPGENNYFGKGVSFCATCDGPFFREKVVAAIGGGDTAVQESLFLTKFVKKVYLIHRRDKLRATSILQQRALKNEKIEFIWDSVPLQIKGDNKVQKIIIKNVKSNTEKSLSVDGCFVWIGITPNTSFLNNCLKLNKQGFIITDTNMETSIKGVFAAGDVRNTPLRQVVTAAADGAIAAVSANHIIDNLI